VRVALQCHFRQLLRELLHLARELRHQLATAIILFAERGLECLHLVQLTLELVDALLQGGLLLLGNAVHLVHFQGRELLPRSQFLIFRGLNVRVEPAELLLCLLGMGLSPSLRLVQRLLGDCGRH
jgi:hypothetical protein